MCLPFDKLLKTSAPNRHLTHIEFLACPQNPKLCVINCLNAYLTFKRTRPHRCGTLQLFLSIQKPFKAVSCDTISRWLKSVLDMAGIDATIFTAHSTRTASTSCACPRRTSLPCNYGGCWLAFRVYVCKILQ